MWKYIKVILKCGPYFAFCYFSWILKYSRHPEKYDINLRFARVQKLIRKILKEFGVSVSEINLEKINNVELNSPNRLFVCNHLSDADPLIFIAYAKRPVSFVAKKEIKKFPVVGRVVKILDGEFIDRDDLKMQLKVFKTIEQRMNTVKGVDWIIFPEGTRNKTAPQEVQEFHYGTFKPAMRNKLDIYILSIYGTQRILDKKAHCKRYIVPLKLDTILTSEDYASKTTVEVSNIAKEHCQNGVTDLIEIDKELTLKFSRKK